MRYEVESLMSISLVTHLTVKCISLATHLTVKCISPLGPQSPSLILIFLYLTSLHEHFFFAHTQHLCWGSPVLPLPSCLSSYFSSYICWLGLPGAICLTIAWNTQIFWRLRWIHSCWLGPSGATWGFFWRRENPEIWSILSAKVRTPLGSLVRQVPK